MGLSYVPRYLLVVVRDLSGRIVLGCRLRIVRTADKKREADTDVDVYEWQ